MSVEQLLAGLQVVEVATGVAGPYAGKLLADYGADVVKVEPPDGDEARRSGPFLDDVPDRERSALFLHLNTNKRSVTLDPSGPGGRDLLERLVSSADVCLESFPPGTLELWGLGFRALHAVNPALVLTSITPFGQDGPYRDYRTSEVVNWALAGMNFTREWDGVPITLGGSLSQYQAGNIAAAATLAAVLHTEAGGGGTHVDVSQMITQVASASGSMTYLVGHAYTGRTSAPPRRPGGELATQAPFGPLPNGIFRCSDGAVMVNTLQGWVPRMLRAVADDDLSALFEEPSALSEDGAAERVKQIVSDWFSARTRSSAQLEAQAAGWPVTAVQSPAELVHDAHFRERGAVVETEHPVAGKMVQPGPPFRIEEGWRLRSTAPLLGEHNDDVYSSLGLGPSELAAYRAAGVI